MPYRSLYAITVPTTFRGEWPGYLNHTENQLQNQLVKLLLLWVNTAMVVMQHKWCHTMSQADESCQILHILSNIVLYNWILRWQMAPASYSINSNQTPLCSITCSCQALNNIFHMFILLFICYPKQPTMYIKHFLMFTFSTSWQRYYLSNDIQNLKQHVKGNMLAFTSILQL